jgi:LCP family protein required for cell wall assembly
MTDAQPEQGTKPERGTKRRVRRIVIVAAASLLAVVGAGAVSAFVAASSLTGNIHRIPNAFRGLAAAARPVMPAATRGAMTILVTGSDTLPAARGGNGADHASRAGQRPSGLIVLLHLNADQKSGAVVSIPPDTLVRVPGHGTTQIDNALPLGGPSLLIQTVEKLTSVRIDHYSIVNFQGLANVLGPLGGVNVAVPERTTSYYGITFHPGINHLGSGAAALAYARQGSLSPVQRVEREQNLLRAILAKIAARHLLGNPFSDYSVLSAFTKALSVDSNFTSSQLLSLALHLHALSGSRATFITVPVQQTGILGGNPAATLNTSLSGSLWQAIRNDSAAAFARQHPATVTAVAPR